MSTENDIVESSSSDSDMDDDTPQPKSGFRGDGEDILPVNICFIIYLYYTVDK